MFVFLDCRLHVCPSFVMMYLLFRLLWGFLLTLPCAVAMVTGLAVTGFGVECPAVFRGPEGGGGGGRSRNSSFSRRWRQWTTIHSSVYTCAHKRVHMDQSDAFKRCKLLLEVQKLIKISIYIYTLLNSICHGFLEFKPLKILWIQHWRRLLKAMITVSTPAWRLHYCCITFV